METFCFAAQTNSFHQAQVCPHCCSPGPPTGSLPHGSCGKAPCFWEILDNTRPWLSQPQLPEILKKVSGVTQKKGKNCTNHEACVCSSPGWRKSSLPGGFFSNLRALEPAGTGIQARISCCYSKKATWGPFAKGAIEDSSRSVNPQHGPAAPGWKKIRAGHVWTPHPLQRPKPVPSPAKITPKSLQCFLEKNQTHLPLHFTFPFSCHSSHGLLN